MPEASQPQQHLQQHMAAAARWTSRGSRSPPGRLIPSIKSSDALSSLWIKAVAVRTSGLQAVGRVRVARHRGCTGFSVKAGDRANVLRKGAAILDLKSSPLRFSCFIDPSHLFILNLILVLLFYIFGSCVSIVVFLSCANACLPSDFTSLLLLRYSRLNSSCSLLTLPRGVGLKACLLFGANLCL